MFKLLKATSADALAISRIIAASWQAAYIGMVPQSYLESLKEDHWQSFIQNWLQNRIMDSYLAMESGFLPVAAVTFGRARDESYSDWGEIATLYVHPGYFHKGYGGALLQAALADLEKQGFTDCYLWVLRENTHARRFYEKHGFTCTTDTIDVEIDSALLTDLRYIRHLG